MTRFTLKYVHWYPVTDNMPYMFSSVLRMECPYGDTSGMGKSLEILKGVITNAMDFL